MQRKFEIKQIGKIPVNVKKNLLHHYNQSFENICTEVGTRFFKSLHIN